MICLEDICTSTETYFSKIAGPTYGINFDFISFDDLENVRNAIQDETKMLWMESPSNPLLKIYDIQAIADI